MTTELYDILGVSATADDDEIKQAYRKKAMKAHPDRGGDQRVFTAVTKAYEILMDPDKRARYDEFGETSPEEALARLGNFVHHMCNPKHDDYLLQPLEELRKLIPDFNENAKEAVRRRDRVFSDLCELKEGGREEEMPDVMLALESLHSALGESIEQCREAVEKCGSLVIQYEAAQEVTGRYQQQQPPASPEMQRMFPNFVELMARETNEQRRREEGLL